MSADLTKQERELLDSVFADNAETETGELYIHQEEALKQLRGAMAYLEKKYPQTKIVYKSFDPLTRITERGSLTASFDDKTEIFKTVIRAYGDDYVYADTLYGYLVQEKYDEALSSLLSAWIRPVKTFTSFYTPVSQEISGSSSVAMLNDYQPLLTRHTDIFVSQPLSLTDSLLDAMKKESYFGSYTVYVSDLCGSENADLKQIRNTAQRMNFNLFDSQYSEGENE